LIVDLLPPSLSLDLAAPMESISSMNMRAGYFSLASWNNFLILEAPTPTYISSNSAPDL